MKRGDGRLDRLARLIPFYIAGGALGAGALYAEYRLAGTVLLVPAFNWASSRIPGGTLTSPEGDYSLSMRNTRLAWRRVGRERGGPAMSAGTEAGWRLSVWEHPAGAVPAARGEPLGAGSPLRRGPDGRVSGIFSVGGKDLLLEFHPPPSAAPPDAAILADMTEIARSLQPAAFKAD